MRLDGESLAYYNNEKVRAATLNSAVPFSTSSLWLPSFLARWRSINGNNKSHSKDRVSLLHM